MCIHDNNLSLSEPTVEEVISIVSTLFQIKGMSQSLGVLQIEIENEEFKQKFAQLAKQIESRNLVARLEKNGDRTFVIISRFQSPKSRRVWIPSIPIKETVKSIAI